MPELTELMLRHGYGDDVVRGIPGDYWLRAALRTVLLNPKTAEQLLATGNCVDYADHEALANRQAADLKFWGQLIKDSGYVPQ